MCNKRSLSDLLLTSSGGNWYKMGSNSIHLFGTNYSRMGQVKFVEGSRYKIWKDMVCLSRPYPFKFFKDCLPQILFGPFLNILSHLIITTPKILVVLIYKTKIVLLQNSGIVFENHLWTSIISISQSAFS